MAGLAGLWRDAAPRRGVRVEVREVTLPDGYTAYTITSDGEWGDCQRPILGYNAKAWVLNDLLGIPDYQEYQEAGAPTPFWETVVRIATSKGCEVTRTPNGMVFVG